MIRSFELQNFKSFPQAEISLNNLTLLCGLNNSGKSSVIQALRMFCNKAEGATTPLLHGHGSIDELRSRMSKPMAPIVFNCHYDDGRKGEFRLNDTGESQSDINAPLVCYLSADRWGPKAFLPMERKLGEFPTIGKHGEFVAEFLNLVGDMLIPKELHHRSSQGETLAYEIAGWLQEIAPGVSLSYETHPKHDTAHVEYNDFRPTNVGFGLSYCLPVLAAILGMGGDAPSGGWDTEWGNKWADKKQSRGILVMIENPEAHLHPQGQTALGRLIAMGASCGVQMVIETQSDHLMDGVRIAIKDEIISHEKVSFHYSTAIPRATEILNQWESQ